MDKHDELALRIYNETESDAVQILDFARRYREALRAEWEKEHREFDWPKLEKPALVGAGRFSIGVSSCLVVEAAHRQHEYNVTPEKEKDRDELPQTVLIDWLLHIAEKASEKPDTTLIDVMAKVGFIPSESRGEIEAKALDVEWVCAIELGLIELAGRLPDQELVHAISSLRRRVSEKKWELIRSAQKYAALGAEGENG